MNEENTISSPAVAGSPGPKKKVRKHVERRERLSDSHIKKLRPKDKLFSVGDSEVPGLRIYVETSGTKNFYYCYKPKNEKNWVRFKLGNFTLLNAPQARQKQNDMALQ